MRHVEALALAGALALMWPAAAQSEQPLSIAQQGYFFVGGKYSTVGDRNVMSGQAYVEFQVPRRKTQPYPLVIIPGAAQTATNFNGTPDGREGWTQYFLRKGYAVYIVEQPGRGRSGYQADVNGPQAYPNVKNVQDRFTAPEKAMLWPQAKLHTQWPGTGVAGDPVFDQFFSSQVPFVQKPDADPGGESRCRYRAARQDRAGDRDDAFAVRPLRLGDARCAAEPGEGAGAGRADVPAGV